MIHVENEFERGQSSFRGSTDDMIASIFLKTLKKLSVNTLTKLIKTNDDEIA